MRKGAYIGMSSIFALSMIALFASNAMAADAPKIDTGDNAWLLASSALVLIMTPGLALFYGGMVRAKNMVNTMWMSFIVICIISVQWVLWGYSLSFAPGGWFIGGLQWCGLGAGVVGQAPSDLLRNNGTPFIFYDIPMHVCRYYPCTDDGCHCGTV